MANGFDRSLATEFAKKNLDLKKLSDMKDDDLCDACEEAGLESMREFKKLKLLLKDKNNLIPEKEFSDHEYPKEIRSLVRPQAITDRLKFDNVVLSRVFGFAWGAICIQQFKNYVAECRVAWGDMKERIDVVRGKVEGLFASGKGVWSVERFMKDKVRLEAVDELKLSNLIVHVSSIIANVDCLTTQISAYRKALFDKELNVKFWKTAEKEFWEECLKDLNNLKVKSDEVLNRLSNHREDVRRRFRQGTINDASSNHKKRRSEQNTLKTVSRKKRRKDNAVSSVVKIVCPDLGLDVNTDLISISSISDENLDNLKPHLHIPGLTSLIEQDFFDGEALQKARNKLEDLKVTARENAAKYQGRKSREAKSKEQSAGKLKQGKINFSVKRGEPSPAEGVVSPGREARPAEVEGGVLLPGRDRRTTEVEGGVLLPGRERRTTEVEGGVLLPGRERRPAESEGEVGRDSRTGIPGRFCLFTINH